MYSRTLEGSLIEIAGELLKKSRAGEVSWQTVGGEPANYYVHFGEETSFIVTLLAPEEGPLTSMIALKIGAAIAARISAKEGEEKFAEFKDVFDEAHRAATGWDQAVLRIQKLLDSGAKLGDPPGDIPI